ncbi:hypothetical protein SAMN05216410_0150 [Sanguibacter gelidistatuariae]|uniref:Phosphodiester glycosidase domain-containing protein n=1 Tax=Sanguibacter gelidistatuariae TaxID=1814289 RepID=A0A1G6XI86_9MICO|nr:hypothetical protein [Sanguibacter gelidistatuariae]SDD77919.1 hypothetical protein SAMN05216410_0150 [Sanguibacter gelidistatuariae]
MTSPSTVLPAPLPDDPNSPLTPPPPRRKTRSPRRRRWTRVVVAILVLVFLAVGTSYARALTYPGSATWQERSVEWVRDHGGNSVVNSIENWYYTRHAPTNASPSAAALPAWAQGSRLSVVASHPSAAGGGPAAIRALPGATALAGEGTWVSGRVDAAGSPAVYTTIFQPDPAHASVVAAAAWMRSSDTTAHLVAGTLQPDGHSWPGNAQVAPADVPALVATFNSGWKVKDIRGGFYLDGRTGARLVDGEASAVIDDQGHISVGQWGRDFTMSSHVRAVRQNLQLVVDAGAPVDGLTANGNGRWGNSKNQLQYTARSGLGVTASGDLVYIAGTAMNLQTLATAMVDAGIVRGMELDIHSNLQSFATWTPSASATTMTPVKLLPSMQRPADRYLAPDQRDFFYLTLR